MCHRFHHGSMKRSTIPPLWHFPNSTEPSEAYYWHHVLRHGQEESCPRTFLGWKSVRQKADFYLLPCWILGGLTLSAPSCGADLPQPPYTQRISVVLALASYEKLYRFHCEFSIAPPSSKPIWNEIVRKADLGMAWKMLYLGDIYNVNLNSLFTCFSVQGLHKASSSCDHLWAHNVHHHFFLLSDALLINLEEKFRLDFTHGCQKTNIDWNWLLCT